MPLQENLEGEGKKSFEPHCHCVEELPGQSTALKAGKNSVRQEINKASTNASALVLIGENLNFGRRGSFLIY